MVSTAVDAAVRLCLYVDLLFQPDERCRAIGSCNLVAKQWCCSATEKLCKMYLFITNSWIMFLVKFSGQCFLGGPGFLRSLKIWAKSWNVCSKTWWELCVGDLGSLVTCNFGIKAIYTDMVAWYFNLIVFCNINLLHAYCVIQFCQL